MKKKWEPKVVNHDFSIIPTEEYKLILEEFAELIYRDFCQLQKDESLDRVLESTGVERTGSDG